MKEVTRIFTVEATYIEKVTDEEYEAIVNGKKAADKFANHIKDLTNADDVTATVQDFVMEKDEE